MGLDRQMNSEEQLAAAVGELCGVGDRDLDRPGDGEQEGEGFGGHERQCACSDEEAFCPSMNSQRRRRSVDLDNGDLHASLMARRGGPAFSAQPTTPVSAFGAPARSPFGATHFGSSERVPRSSGQGRSVGATLVLLSGIAFLAVCAFVAPSFLPQPASPESVPAADPLEAAPTAAASLRGAEPTAPAQMPPAPAPLPPVAALKATDVEPAVDATSATETMMEAEEHMMQAEEHSDDAAGGPEAATERTYVSEPEVTPPPEDEAGAEAAEAAEVTAAFTEAMGGSVGSPGADIDTRPDGNTGEPQAESSPAPPTAPQTDGVEVSAQPASKAAAATSPSSADTDAGAPGEDREEVDGEDVDGGAGDDEILGGESESQASAPTLSPASESQGVAEPCEAGSTS